MLTLLYFVFRGTVTSEPKEVGKLIRREDLRRITEGLECALDIIRDLASEEITINYKSDNDPVTVIDRTIDERLRELLPRGREGWLSEETEDDLARLDKRRVWVVDPLDGTREFVNQIPEWCVSIGLVEDGRAVAGGISNPATGETFLGSIETGVTLNGKPIGQQTLLKPKDAVVLASRSEMKRGEWERFRDAPFMVCPMGSVAYKLACVAGGLAQATWTLVPKNEWDVAAGAALVLASGGIVSTPTGVSPTFNQPNPRLEGFLAFSAGSDNLLTSFEEHRNSRF